VKLLADISDQLFSSGKEILKLRKKAVKRPIIRPVSNFKQISLGKFKVS